MTKLLLWVYILLLLAGGLMGYFKAKSRVSLLTSAGFAAALVLCAVDVVFKAYVADLLLAALLVVFALRLSKTRRFMPSGFMLAATAITLLVRHL